MEHDYILGKSKGEWLAEFPILQDLCDLKETCWRNPDQLPYQQAVAQCALTMADIQDASARLQRFASYFISAFPETRPLEGLLESPMVEIPRMKTVVETQYGKSIDGNLMVKLDSHLPISGSIKARGGIYEVLKLAEDIALKEGYLTLEDDYQILDTPRFRALFSRYAVAVGSTGNLGLSIGIISAKLGFKVAVHMSADARQWKKDLLRSKGVEVYEYASDYSVAVKEGRMAAQDNPFCHFVDDENSKTLFLGYAVAALRLKNQCAEQGIVVDARHPLCVYLPCGVGGGPGGVAFGIKMVFGAHAHCYFAEPTHSCCMLLGMATDYHDQVSVQEFGIDNKTVADGLAVGRASGFVGRFIKPFLDGCYTVTDSRMYQLLAQLADSQDIWLEPSALAGMIGPIVMGGQETADTMPTHLIWATGGNMVPQDTMQAYYRTGKADLHDTPTCI